MEPGRAQVAFPPGRVSDGARQPPPLALSHREIPFSGRCPTHLLAVHEAAQEFAIARRGRVNRAASGQLQTQHLERAVAIIIGVEPSQD